MERFEKQEDCHIQTFKSIKHFFQHKKYPLIKQSVVLLLSGMENKKVPGLVHLCGRVSPEPCPAQHITCSVGLHLFSHLLEYEVMIHQADVDLFVQIFSLLPISEIGHLQLHLHILGP